MSQITALAVKAALEKGQYLWNISRYGIDCDKPDVKCYIIDQFLTANAACLIDTKFKAPNTNVNNPSVTETLNCGLTIVQPTPVVCDSLTINKKTIV